ncbi:MAG: hypothetical protein J5764_01570 [Bacteroidales bacterium]|nr:hypothetical protein [Bacteroidales bacterium]
MYSRDKKVKKTGYIRPDYSEIKVVLRSFIAQSDIPASKPEGWDIDGENEEFEW